MASPAPTSAPSSTRGRRTCHTMASTGALQVCSPGQPTRWWATTRATVPPGTANAPIASPGHRGGEQAEGETDQPGRRTPPRRREAERVVGAVAGRRARAPASRRSPPCTPFVVASHLQQRTLAVRFAAPRPGARESQDRPCPARRPAYAHDISRYVTDSSRRTAPPDTHQTPRSTPWDTNGPEPTGPRTTTTTRATPAATGASATTAARPATTGPAGARPSPVAAAAAAPVVPRRGSARSSASPTPRSARRSAARGCAAVTCAPRSSTCCTAPGRPTSRSTATR